MPDLNQNKEVQLEWLKKIYEIFRDSRKHSEPVKNEEQALTKEDELEAINPYYSKYTYSAVLGE